MKPSQKKKNCYLLLSIITFVGTIKTCLPLFANPILTQNQEQQGMILAQDSEESKRIQLFEKVKNSVVQIRAQSSIGSGFIVSADGLVVTNAHVVSDIKNANEKITIILGDGTELTGNVLGFHQNKDLALIKIPNQTKLPALPLADPKSLKTGQSVYAIGSPFGIDNFYTNGILNRIDIKAGRLDHSAQIRQGNSGGPLVNSRGEVIGVNTSIYIGKNSSEINPAISAAIPVDQISYFLKAYKAQVPPFLNPDVYASKTLQVQELPLDGNPIESTLKAGDNVEKNNVYYQLYTFEGSQNQQLTLEMTSETIDPSLVLYQLVKDEQNPEKLLQVEITTNEDISPQNPNAKIVISLPETGIYLIKATTFQPGESGDFQLKATLR